MQTGTEPDKITLADGEGHTFKASFWEEALGVMDRLVLGDAQWNRISGLIIGRPDQRGSTGRDNRMFVEGVLWIVRMGSP
jgi:putative transposase